MSLQSSSQLRSRALQIQLEPHFLFNALNALTELERKDEAVEMLSHLNTILKSTLARNAPEKISLSQTLKMVDGKLYGHRPGALRRFAMTAEPLDTGAFEVAIAIPYERGAR